ncbi:MAG: phytoene desaturase family protein [Rhizobiaceae bacterium]|jgi:1-hydroxycarotenoid 3,4-desaturase|nr:phytoene desaturase family protein [Rhizobiaceae bacterium]
MKRNDRVIIIGAGMGGIAAAVRLSALGFAVDVYEKEPAPGGKMREVPVGPDGSGRRINAGPTVFTMRWVFDELLDAGGVRLDDVLEFQQADVLARHAWTNGPTLDLHADIAASSDAIAEFAGPGNADGYRRFCADSAAIFRTLKRTYIAAERPTPMQLMNRIGLGSLGEMMALRPFATLWGALGDYFSDPRLRQLFGRYATYCGSSPYAAPATLMLVAHVEQDGVFIAKGGMHGLARALVQLAQAQGATFHFGAGVKSIATQGGRVGGVFLEDDHFQPAEAVIHNGDVSALANGLLGTPPEGVAAVKPDQRSLSALTFALEAQLSGFVPAHHTVLFSDAYEAEFGAIFRQGRIPDKPTTYLCLPDRTDAGAFSDGRFDRDGYSPESGERVFALINAPANGDTQTYSSREIDVCLKRMMTLMERCGLTATLTAPPRTAASPTEFNRLFPGSGGALYGPASHGWMASFKRQGARTAIQGLYLAGGSVHPGPGVPMAALSGRLAAECLVQDRATTPRFRPAATSGGMPTD